MSSRKKTFLNLIMMSFIITGVLWNSIWLVLISGILMSLIFILRQRFITVQILIFLASILLTLLNACDVAGLSFAISLSTPFIWASIVVLFMFAVLVALGNYKRKTYE